MPTTNEAVDFLKTKVDIYIPAKAANAGGVATSALEMAQNSARLFWTSEEVSFIICRGLTLIYMSSDNLHISSINHMRSYPFFLVG